MDPLTGGALIGAGAGLVGNLASQAGNAFASRRANRRLVEFWKMQNAYNHPTAQMQRLQEAGLNPNLIYGDSVSGATGRADSIGTPDKPHFENPVQDIGLYQNLTRTRAQTNLLETQNTLTFQKAVMESVKTANESLKGIGMRYDNVVKSELAKYSAQVQEQSLRKLQQQVIGQEIDNMVKDHTSADKIKTAFYQMAAARENVKYIKSGTALRDLEASLKKEGLENAPFWARWIYRQIEKMPDMYEFFGQEPEWK